MSAKLLKRRHEIIEAYTGIEELIRGDTENLQDCWPIDGRGKIAHNGMYVPANEKNPNERDKERLDN